MKRNTLTKILLIIYVAILTWIIIFKMNFNLNILPYMRIINLIPLKESVLANGKIYYSEIFYNILIFIPLGIYLGMIKKESKFIKKLTPIICLTLIYETLQFILHIGTSDITDIITNTLGGAVGIGIINFLYKIFKNKQRVDNILNSLAAICTIAVITIICIILIETINNKDIVTYVTEESSISKESNIDVKDKELVDNFLPL